MPSQKIYDMLRQLTYTGPLVKFDEVFPPVESQYNYNDLQNVPRPEGIRSLTLALPGTGRYDYALGGA